MVRVAALFMLASLALAQPKIVDNHFRKSDYLHLFDNHGATEASDATQEFWYDKQKLDHSNASNPQVWSQRYFFNDEYYGGPGSPVFLSIEGEWTGSSQYVTSKGYFMNALAKKHNALLVSLEHRFYGKSQPFADLSTANLKFLHSAQALADITTFQDHFSATQNLTNATKWVAFGGSYSGMLAAWLKLKYPRHFVGAVASSAPINAKVDFYEYSVKVSQGLQFFGGRSCTKNVEAAMEALHRLVASTKAKDVETLKRLFNPCFDWTSDDDRGVFEQQIFLPFQTAAQTNDFDASGSTALTQICDVFANTTASPLENLSRYIGNTGDDKCTYNSFQGYVDYYNDITVGDDLMARQWFYQTCAEFGFGQTTESGYGAFVPLQYITVDMAHNKFCGLVFNITNTESRVAKTNLDYGGLNINVANVVFSSGTIDPWDGLALTNATGTKGPLSEVVSIVGTSHCRDLYARRAGDSGHLVWAHQRVERGVARFLGASEVERKAC